MNKVITIAFSTFFACSIFATDNVAFIIKAVEKSSGQSVDTIDQAIALLQKSNDARQISLLGLCYYNGLGVKKDLDKAYNLFEQAAKKQDSLGLYWAGFCNLKGIGTTYSIGKAYNGVDFLEKAAALGNTDAMVLLASVYNEGKLVPADNVQAIKYLRSSAAKDNAQAKYQLGCWYRDGIAVEKSYDEAFKWLEKSSDAGNLFAQAALGDCFIKGVGCKVNYEKGLDLINQAALKKNSLAITLLGIIDLTNGALDALNEMRGIEGDKLVQDMCARMKTIEETVKKVKGK